MKFPWDLRTPWKLLTQQIGMKVQGRYRKIQRRRARKKKRKRQIDLSLYDQLERITGEPLAWGVLTGVRPTKLAMQKLEAGWKKEDYINWAWESARVRGEKQLLHGRLPKENRKF